jgi:hypothetical protein
MRRKSERNLNWSRCGNDSEQERRVGRSVVEMRLLYSVLGLKYQCCDMKQLLLRNEATTSEIIPAHLHEDQVDF